MPSRQTDRADNRRICVLANPGSGSDRAGTDTNLIEEGFARCGRDATVWHLRKGDDIAERTRQAVADGFDIIVSAGGDGTMSSVAGALAAGDAVMGILPLGTFNYFARSLDIPDDLDAAISLICNGPVRDVPLSAVNGRVFLNNASLGIYPQILKTRETTYARWGRSRLAAYWSVIATLMRLPRPLALRIATPDREISVRTPLAFVVANAFQLRQMGLNDGVACIEKGAFAVLIAPNAGRFGLLLNGLALALGITQRDREFALVCAQSIKITPKRRRLLVARDGERSRMTAPFTFARLDTPLRVIAPQVGAAPER